jgi:hypothetical protein
MTTYTPTRTNSYPRRMDPHYRQQPSEAARLCQYAVGILLVTVVLVMAAVAMLGAVDQAHDRLRDGMTTTTEATP